MNKKEFEVLRCIAEAKGQLTQRIISEKTGHSLGAVNKVISDAVQKEWIDDSYRITIKGLDALSPYKVKHAIVLAAGMSTRFAPFSYEKPKGLTVVKGEVLIERQIRQLKEAGIEEIVLVLGHMMEKFLYLAGKFNVKIVINNEYRHKNTHSSIYFSRDYLKSSYICCADNYFPQSVFHAYEYHSIYSVIYMPGIWRGERGVITNRNGLIVETERPACDKWVMNGFAYFNEEFADKFKLILEEMWNKPGTDGLYWEQVYAEHVNELPLYAVKYKDTEVMEFDSVAELEVFDPDFIKYNDIPLTKNICKVLNCSIADIHDIRPMEMGYTNKSFKFRCGNEFYVYRSPGAISAEWIDRRFETNAQEIAKRLGIDDSYIYEDPNEGWKISKYVDITEKFDFSNESHLTSLCAGLRKLYSDRQICGRPWDYLYEAKKLLEKIKVIDEETYTIAIENLSEVEKIDDLIKKQEWPICMVHNDLYEDNLMVSDEKLYIIDWEYAGDSDIGYDLCKLFVKNHAFGEDIDKWLSFYYQRKPTADERSHIVGCAAVSFYYWYIWAIYMIKKGNDYSDLMYKYLNIFQNYRKDFFGN